MVTRPEKTKRPYPRGMLFDLRGRGRRRVIQVIYACLALLMGGGLVFFGIGGNTSGGLFDAFKNDVRTGGGGEAFTKRVNAAERKVALTPREATAWAALARLRYQEATATGYDQQTSAFNDNGKKQLLKVAAAWSRYVALDPKKPDANLANLMVQAFGPTGINQPAKAVEAMEIVVDSRKASAALYGQLAVLAYTANQTRKGDLAAAKAVSLAPKLDREALKSQLEQAKTQALSQALQQQQG